MSPDAQHSWLSTVMTSDEKPTTTTTTTTASRYDFSEFGLPTPEWQELVARHPEEGATARLPDDKTGPELQSQHNEDRREQSQSNFEAEGLGGSVTIKEEVIRDDGGGTVQDRLTARVYTRNQREDELRLDRLPGVVYYHGGGYVFGGPDTERHLCSLLASRLRVVVVHVCYREAPQHPHPAAHDDGKAGFEWVFRNAGRLGIDRDQIVVVGLSCGAGIAASTTLRVCNEDAEETDHGDGASPPRPSKRMRTKGDGDGEQGVEDPDLQQESDEELPSDKVVDRFAPRAGREKPKGRIRGLLLIVPWLLQESSFPYHLFRSREVSSRVQCAKAPLMSKAVYDRLTDMLGAEDRSDPLLNVPLAENEELKRLPRTAFMVAGMDLFRDDGLILAERLRELGVPRRVHMFKGLPHGFRKYDDLWGSKRFDELFLLLINWALERTVSSMDEGFHVEERPEHSERAKDQEESAPFATRQSADGEKV